MVFPLRTVPLPLLFSVDLKRKEKALTLSEKKAYIKMFNAYNIMEIIRVDNLKRIPTCSPEFIALTSCSVQCKLQIFCLFVPFFVNGFIDLC